MTVQDYLLKFRKISSLESLEKLFDHLNYTLTDDMDIVKTLLICIALQITAVPNWFPEAACLM